MHQDVLGLWEGKINNGSVMQLDSALAITVTTNAVQLGILEFEKNINHYDIVRVCVLTGY